MTLLQMLQHEADPLTALQERVAAVGGKMPVRRNGKVRQGGEADARFLQSPADVRKGRGVLDGVVGVEEEDGKALAGQEMRQQPEVRANAAVADQMGQVVGNETDHGRHHPWCIFLPSPRWGEGLGVRGCI